MDIKELRTWILEELDQNLRLLTAISAFRFKQEVLPHERIRVLKLHHHYLLRMLNRLDNPLKPGEAGTIAQAMDTMAEAIEHYRVELLEALPDNGEGVAELFNDPAWDHHSREMMDSFAPDDVLMEEQQEKQRMEGRTLPAEADLRLCLQGLPGHWLRVIHKNVSPRHSDDLGKARFIAGITAALEDEENLGRILAGLTDQQTDLLLRLAGSDGYGPLGDIRQRFGDDDMDGYYWDIHPPRTTMGSLRALGLLYVGVLAGGDRQVVMIPAVLRAYIARGMLPNNVVRFPGR